MNRLLLLVPLLAGCGAFEAFLPDVLFDRFEVDALSFDEADVDFVFTVDNPNPVRIRLSSFSYALDFEETPVFDGDNAEGFQLESEGSSELRLPVTVVWQEAWDVVQATKGEDEVDFGLAGHFGFDVPELGEAKVPYDEGGRFPAVRTPKFSVKRLRVDSLNLTSATLALDLGVTNEHGSSLDFTDFDYAIQLADNDVATGFVRNLVTVDGASEGEVSLPIELDLLTTGVTIVDAVTSGGKLPVTVDATMSVDTPFGIIPLDIVEVAEQLIE